MVRNSLFYSAYETNDSWNRSCMKFFFSFAPIEANQPLEQRCTCVRNDTWLRQFISPGFGVIQLESESTDHPSRPDSKEPYIVVSQGGKWTTKRALQPPVNNKYECDPLSKWIKYIPGPRWFIFWHNPAETVSYTLTRSWWVFQISCPFRPPHKAKFRRTLRAEAMVRRNVFWF